MRILICGGRDYGEGEGEERKQERIDFGAAFIKLMEKHGDEFVVINGGCKTGADKLARATALHLEMDCETYPARWRKEGNPAGPRRNQRMVDQAHPHAGVAFPGGDGTADMVRRLRKVGIPVWIPYGGVKE